MSVELCAAISAVNYVPAGHSWLVKPKTEGELSAGRGDSLPKIFGRDFLSRLIHDF